MHTFYTADAQEHCKTHTFYTADAQEHFENAYILYRGCGGTLLKAYILYRVVPARLQTTKLNQIIKKYEKKFAYKVFLKYCSFEPIWLSGAPRPFWGAPAPSGRLPDLHKYA